MGRRFTDYREIYLVRKRFCEDRMISDENSVAITWSSYSRATDEHCFLMEHSDGRSELYIHPKVNLAGLSALRSLDIPATYRNDFDVQHNKSMIADWVHRITGHHLIDTDISALVREEKTLTVVISPDSMRFANSFQLNRL